VDNLIPHLVQATSEHRSAARSLLAQGEVLRKLLVNAMDEMWTRLAGVDEEASVEARLLQQNRVEAINKVVKPEPPHQGEWREDMISAAFGAS
jgi:hypothetical protein